MSVNEAIKLYRSKGLLNDNDHDLPAVDALLDAGYTIKWRGPVDFNAGHASWGMEFLDGNGKVEYWCVIAK